MFRVGIAAADDTQAGWTPDHGAPDNGPPPLGTPGRGYALGGAHVLGIPYDEYIKRTGADWFPGLDRQIVDYPAGQVQGHTLERLFPGIGRLDDNFPGLGIDGPSIGESVDEGEGNLIRRSAMVAPAPRSVCPKGRWCSTPCRRSSRTIRRRRLRIR